MTNEFLTIIWKYLFIPIIIYVANYAVAYFKAKIDDIAEKANDEAAKKIIKEANEIISTCVLATTQTYVDTLKKEDKFDLAAQKEALKITSESVYQLMSDEMKGYITASYGDVEAYVTKAIEAEIAKAKN